VETGHPRTLGTLLRHLTELLDGAVEETYKHSGLDYRPRYTTVMRACSELGPASIRAISLHAGITHSAVSQTVSEMAKRDLVRRAPGSDGRERLISLTARGRALLPALRRHWAATNRAARELDDELPQPLSGVLRAAIEALDRRPFRQRIDEAAAAIKSKKA
jgi:DNA-binding MarR family transcriptional regulator